MDPVSLRYFEDELRHLRDVAWEFAEENKKVGNRLGLGLDDCGDPYVERLLEGFAFLASRIQRKLDDEFPTFTRHLLEMVYPDYLAPTPSMVVAALVPDPRAGNLVDGFLVDRDTRLTARLGADEETRCTFLTKHSVNLWPIQIKEAVYLSGGSLTSLGLGQRLDVKAALRLRLQTLGGIPMSDLSLDELPLYLSGSEGLAAELYETIIRHGVGLLMTPIDGSDSQIIEHAAISTYGFDDDQALLPCSQRGFQGYRLLKEYFCFPERFFFVRLSRLGLAIRRCQDAFLDVYLLLDDKNSALEGRVNSEQFIPFATPAINLFPKTAEPVLIEPHSREFHLVADRTNSLDYEIHSIRRVTGIGDRSEQKFSPFYEVRDLGSAGYGFYTIDRRERVLSTKQKRQGKRSGYSGSEVYISLVEAAGTSLSDLQRLTVDVMCTNRDLAISMPTDVRQSHLTADSGAPIDRIICLARPTRPRPALANGHISWNLINHLSLNYRSIVDDADGGGAEALRALLSLYRPEQSNGGDLEGLTDVSSKPVVRRLPFPGPVTFGRGLEIDVTFEERRMHGDNAFLLGAVLEQFFSKYVTLNSFAETVVTTLERGEIMRWPIRLGSQHPL